MKGLPLILFLLSWSLDLSGLLAASPNASDGVREIDLALAGLTYDPLTEKLYGARTNELIQIDPESTAVLNSFDMGGPIQRIALGTGGSLWVGIQGAVRRFDLNTLSPEDPILVPGDIYDLAPSPSDPYTAAVSTPTIHGRYATGWIIKNGARLPDTHFFEAIGLNGTFIFGHVPTGFGHGPAARLGVGPNGIVSQGSAGVGVWVYGFFKALDSHVYHSSGAGFNAQTLERTETITVYTVPTIMGVNQDEKTIYFLTSDGDSNGSYTLNRHSHPSLRRTGFYRFAQREPNLDPLVSDLVAWSSNRVAFNSAQKLFLLDTSRLFLPADIEVIQTVRSSSITFGEEAVFTITVTNKGPGVALELFETNSLSAPTNLAEYNPFEPGFSYTADLVVLATEPGTITNVAGLIFENDMTTANNTVVSSVSVVKPSGRIAPISLTVADLDYDLATEQLYLLANGALRSVDPEGSRILAPLGGRVPLSKFDISSKGGDIAAFDPSGAVEWVDTRLAAVGPVFGGVGRTLFDITISPADRSIIALSDETGTYLTKDGNRSFAISAQQGDVEFSDDGSTIYFVNGSTCALEVYRLEASGLVHQITRSDVNCSGFTAMNGFLFFNNGLVYEPETGERMPYSLSLAPPSLVVARTNGTVDVLNRLNGVFTVRRFNRGESSPFATVPLAGFASTPVEMVEAGPDRLALRTADANRNLALINLDDSDLIQLEVFTGENGPLKVSFLSKAGSQYRLERKAALSDGSWTVVRDNIPGTGERIDTPIDVLSDEDAFYRLFLLP